MVALVGFVVLTTVAMVIYRGGNAFDKTAVSYVFTQNFFSDLGMSVSYLGEPKLLVMVLFIIALGGVGFGLIGYSVASPAFFRQTAVSHWLARIGSFFGVLSGLSYIGIAVTPSNLYLDQHKLFVLMAFGGFAITAVFYTLAILFNKSYPNQYAYAYSFFAVALVFYVWFILYGPSFDTAEGATVQVIGQKLIVYLSIFSMMIQTYGAQQQLKAIGD
jgi:hypothetical protein